MAHDFVTVLSGQIAQQRLKFGGVEFDELSSSVVDQMITMRTTSQFITRATMLKRVTDDDTSFDELP